jgi:hypothetical protein
VSKAKLLIVFALAIAGASVMSVGAHGTSTGATSAQLRVSAKAPSYWSEASAEKILLRKLRVPCKNVRTEASTFDCNVSAARRWVLLNNERVELFKKAKAAFGGGPQLTGSEQRRFRYLQDLFDGGTVPGDPSSNLGDLLHGFPISRADCIGGGPADSSGYRFSTFRCKITVDDDTNGMTLKGRIVVYVTGRTTFRWHLI